MTSDRELLEAAAKAAGFKEAVYQDWAGMDVRYGCDAAIWNGDTYWNPLVFDGDALRLAVKLGLDVYNYKGAVAGDAKEHVHVCPFDGSGKYGERSATEIYGTDPYAATRRAIVRAAAEMAK